ncbi:hypothetical protein J6590_087432 [Homalodisca vitripennis]|nr:hypothetical protein J6590_087432 [Homalodisca vitripennis]
MHVFLFDGEHTLTLNEAEWTQFTNSLPLMYIALRDNFIIEESVRFTIHALASGLLEEDVQWSPANLNTCNPNVELAIVGNSFQCQIIFKPPFPRERLSAKNRTTARWLEDNYHKISWEEGDYPYRANVLGTLCKPFAVIYTRGLEKAEFLRKFHGDVRELDDIVCEEAGNPCSCKTTHRFSCSLPQHTSTEDPNVKCAMISAKCRFEILNKQLHNTK